GRWLQFQRQRELRQTLIANTGRPGSSVSVFEVLDARDQGNTGVRLVFQVTCDALGGDATAAYRVGGEVVVAHHADSRVDGIADDGIRHMPPVRAVSRLLRPADVVFDDRERCRGLERGR